MKNYWKIFLFAITLILIQSSCAAQSWRRGVTFYEGDKSSYEITQQSQLISNQIRDYENRVKKLTQERANIIARSDMMIYRQIRVTEMEINKLQGSIDELSEVSRQDPESLLSELRQLDQQLAEKEAKLAEIKNSSDYPERIKSIDLEIESLQFNINHLMSANANMLVKMSNTDRTSYFAGNIRNGYEASSAYLLMKWANKVNDPSEIGLTEDGEFTILVRNDFVRTVVAQVSHTSGWQTSVLLQPKSQLVLNVPFPGSYSCFFQHGNRRGNTVSKTINPLSQAIVDGERYNIVFLQPNW